MTPKIPVNDLSRAIAADRAEIDQAFAGTLDSGWLVHGENHTAFEREFAEYLATTDVIGVGNGTDALTIALRAVGVGAGDRVCTVANAGFYTSTACLQIGAVPLYVDVDPSNLNISAAALEAALAEEPSAVVVTHLYGQLAPVEDIVARCKDLGVPVIEDCAQAAGARTAGGRAAGTVGAIAAYSFYPTKNLAALGDGGAIATGDRDIADRCRELRQYGWTARYTVERVGMNSRLDELQAAALRVRLPKLDARNARRREICSAYAEALASSMAITPVLNTDTDHVGHLAVMRTAERDRLRDHLASAGVGSDIHYPIADDQQPIWEKSGHAMIAENLQETHAATREILTVPCFPELSDDEIARVAAALASFR